MMPAPQPCFHELYFGRSGSALRFQSWVAHSLPGPAIKQTAQLLSLCLAGRRKVGCRLLTKQVIQHAVEERLLCPKFSHPG